ncbi:hypothetical protein HanIR_Chr02g0066531 [Helianthus annuus]|nr:hypothetical protein HanIR_Chr02g0066531 [Helianthus annuus]
MASSHVINPERKSRILKKTKDHMLKKIISHVKKNRMLLKKKNKNRMLILHLVRNVR